MIIYELLIIGELFCKLIFKIYRSYYVNVDSIDKYRKKIKLVFSNKI